MYNCRPMYSSIMNNLPSYYLTFKITRMSTNLLYHIYIPTCTSLLHRNLCEITNKLHTYITIVANCVRILCTLNTFKSTHLLVNEHNSTSSPQKKMYYDHYHDYLITFKKRNTKPNLRCRIFSRFAEYK